MKRYLISIALTGGELEKPVVWSSTSMEAYDAGDAANLATLNMRLNQGKALAACTRVELRVEEVVESL